MLIFFSSTPVANPTCTTTIRTLNQFDLSPTTTVYAVTQTAFSLVDCGGCSLIIENLLGPGPVCHLDRPPLSLSFSPFLAPGLLTLFKVRQITATVSQEITTAKEIVCSPTPES